MLKNLKIFLAGMMLMALPAFAGGKRVALAVLPLERHTMMLQAADGASPGDVKATANPHSIVFTWTTFTSSVPSLTVGISCSTTSGGESSTALTLSGLTSSSGTGTWSSPTAGDTYYCEAFSIAPNPAGGTQYSLPSNQVAVTVPLAQSDLPVPASFAGSAH